MAIRWDPVLVRDVAHELVSRIGGGRLRAFLLDPEPRNLLLFGREWTLAWELHPTAGYLQLLPAREPPPEARPFAARVHGVEATADDRVLTLSLRKLRGRGPSLEVVVELLGNRWNALLVETDSATIRHTLVTSKGAPAPRSPGSPYTRPEGQRRRGWNEPLELDEWKALLLPLPPTERRKSLLRTVAYTSSLNAPALLGPAAGTAGGPEVEEALETGWALWRRLRLPGEAEPTLLRGPKGPQPYSLPLPGWEADRMESLMEAFHRAREEGEPERPSVLVPWGLVRALQDRIGEAERRIRSLERERERAPDPEPLRRTGDLLLARFKEVPQGVEEVTLDDFEGGRVTIALDPTLSPDQNAARYYGRASRAERARTRIPGLIEGAKERLEGLRRLRRGLEEGELETEEVRERAGIPKPRGGAREGRRGPAAEPSPPYRSYRSSGGLEIRVGRGAAHNDDLTFHHSKPDDVWLHARHASGAHVILRWTEEGSPPARDLTEAAVLAALHSEARTSGSVPVDWTRRKYVRKPRKSPPGAVVPDRIQTVFVEPDPAVEKRLKGP